MMADLIDGLDITFPSLDNPHKNRVKQTLNDYVEVDNPLDYHTFIWGDRKRTSECFKQMISGNFAATSVHFINNVLCEIGIRVPNQCVAFFNKPIEVLIRHT